MAITAHYKATTSALPLLIRRSYQELTDKMGKNQKIPTYPHDGVCGIKEAWKQERRFAPTLPCGYLSSYLQGTGSVEHFLPRYREFVSIPPNLRKTKHQIPSMDALQRD
jgi:hypothetical protein